MLERFRRLVRVTPQRFESMRGFVIRHGPFGVFVARFIAGLRFLAGPLAGAIGLRFIPFTTANVLGALVFVPVAVGVGYAGGYGVGDRKSTRLNSSHLVISYAVFCLKKKKNV